MDETTVQEIQRTSLTSVILSLKCMGIANVLEFQYLDPPEERMILEALRQLYYFSSLGPGRSCHSTRKTAGRISSATESRSGTDPVQAAGL